MKVSELMYKTYMIFLLILTTACGVLNTLDEEELTEEQRQWVDLVNAKRQSGYRCGSEYFPAVDPIAWNEELTVAAQRHSDDMFEHDHFDL